jgi:hypothetical protein
MQDDSYRRRSVRARATMRTCPHTICPLVGEDLPVIPAGCWPALDEEVDDDAELRALAQGTGEHLPHELRVRVLELRARRSRPWPPQAA